MNKIQDIQQNTWKKDVLGYHIKVQGGNAFCSSDYKDNGIPLVRIGNIGKGFFNPNNFVYLPSEIVDANINFQLEEEDILIGMTGDLGKICKIKKENLPAILNQRVGRIVFLNGGIDRDFLYHNLLSEKTQKKLERYFIGAAQKNISPSQIESIEILVPPLAEQKKIAVILSKVDEDMEKTDEVIKKTEKLKRGLMQELLRKGEEIKLNQISKIKRGASPRPIGDKKYFSEKGRGWIRISDITKAYKYLKKTKQYLSELGEKASVAVNKGDLIMSICATVGKPIIIDIPACIHDGFVLFGELDKKLVDTNFLFYALVNIENKFLGKGQTGSQKNLNTTIVSNMKINLPSLNEQKKIAVILSKLDDKIGIYQKTKLKLGALKKGLMRDLLSEKKI